MTVSEALEQVLTEEAQRQKVSARAVGEKAGHKNALYKLRKGKTVTVESFWSLAGALDLGVDELAYRVNQRLRSAT